MKSDPSGHAMEVGLAIGKSPRSAQHLEELAAQPWVDPEKEVTFVLLTNDPVGAGPLRPRVSNAVAAALL